MAQVFGYIQSGVLLCVGLSLFLFGMKIMTDGFYNAAGDRLERFLKKVSGNRFSGLLAGTGVTAVIHSSTATTVMVVGFVNAGVMTLFQAAGVIMGANIGTTVTGLIVALESLNVGLFLQLPLVPGILLITLSKNQKKRRVGYILAGVGIIFCGLSMMSTAVGSLEESKLLKFIFGSVKNPLVLMLAGGVLTAVIQSSTAVNSLIITLAVPFGMTGGLDIIDGLYIILGTNVGTCVTALLASADTNINAKRASVLHLLFNVFGTLLFAFIFALMPKTVLAGFLSAVFGSNVKFQLAWFNFFQNLICALIMLPFIKPLTQLAEGLVHDRPTGDKKNT